MGARLSQKSIPMLADFGKTYPETTIFVTAVGDSDSRAHDLSKSLHLGDFATSCLAEILILDAQLNPEG
jgi:cysteinylglycine-S-conjugate dipeptidase